MVLDIHQEINHAVRNIEFRNLEMTTSHPRQEEESRDAVAQIQATASRLPHRPSNARRKIKIDQTADPEDAVKPQPPKLPSYTNGAAQSEISSIRGMQSHDLSMPDMHRQNSRSPNEQVRV